MARGSIRQRGRGSWELRMYAGVDAATGRQRYATRTVHGSRRAAVRALDDLAVEVDNARSHAGTVGDLLQRWLAAASPGWAPTTVAHTRSIIDCHLVPHLGHLEVAKLTTADIDDFYGDLLRCGGRAGTGLAPGTVHRVHSVLHRALVQALLAVVVDRPLLWCLLRLAATTGARRGQLLALQWRDVDLGRGVIAFTRALVIGPDGPVLGATKTDTTHCTDLDAESAEGLGRCRAAAEQRAADAGVTLSGAAFVFTDDADGRRPWASDRATRQFIAARRAADLPHFRLHDLRHFMATEL